MRPSARATIGYLVYKRYPIVAPWPLGRVRRANKGILHTTTNPLQTTNIFPTNPWEDTEQVSKLHQQTHVVIKKSPSSQQVTESDLLVLVSTHGIIRVDKTRQNKSGDIVVKLTTLNYREKFTSKLSEKFPNAQISIDLLPTISIANMEYSYTPEELTENLLKYHRTLK